MRDSQRSKVYGGEGPLIRSAYGTEASWEELQQFTNKVLQSKWVMKHWGVRTITLVKGGRGARAQSSRYRFDRSAETWKWSPNPVVLGTTCRNKVVLLHELAHHFAGLHHGHDWKFASVYLDLVKHFLGADAHSILKSGFDAKKVKYHKPRKKKPLTEEQRAAAVERMAKARAAKAAKQAQTQS